MINKIALSTGHSRVDPGGIGIGGVQEYDLNLMLAYQIMDFTLPDGIFYRSDLDCEDLPKGKALAKTIENINKVMPLGAIEIHHNTNAKASVKGCWVIYWRNSKQGYLWASYLAAELQTAVPKINAVDNSWCGNKRDGFLRGTHVPAIVFEAGFITNKDDLIITQNNRLKIAYAIREGTKKWLAAI